MTTYKELFGNYVQNYSSDPTSTDAEGQIWYNSTSGTFKTALGSYGVWSAGGNLNTGRYALGGAGTQTAGLTFGGTAVPGNTNSTEAYNGTSWTAGGNLNTTRNYITGTGLQTAALAFGGYTTASSSATEAYNGTSWTAGGNLNTARYGSGGAGIQTSALNFGGYTTAVTNATESYNGSTWTSAPNMNTSRYVLGGCGTQTSALGFGGLITASSNATESYNGTSWTSVNNLNTARDNLAGSGLQTLALAFGGQTTAPANTTATELWNGTSWTSNPTGLGTARRALSGTGTRSASLAIGGYVTAAVSTTEEWDYSVTVPVAGSWSSGGNLPSGNGRTSLASFGSQTAAIIAGGDLGPATTATSFTYNGTSWSPSPSLNTARAGIMRSTNAPQTAGVVFGGFTTYPNMLTATELWNGSAWTNNPTGLNTARQNGGGAGIQTAAICVGGEVPGPAGTTSNAVENFNGTSWTTSPVTFPSSGPGIRGFGLQTAAIFIKSGVSQSWNGTAFSAAGTQNNPSDNRGVFGIQTAGIAAGVQASPVTGATELWNGTAWTTNPNSLSTARYNSGTAGTSDSGLLVGGYTGSVYSESTEEWTGPSTTLNYKTLTTSQFTLWIN